MDNKTFEEKLNELEALVNKLNKESLPLEESLKLFEQGKILASSLQKELDEASSKVAKIIEDDNEEEFIPEGL